MTVVAIEMVSGAVDIVGLHVKTTLWVSISTHGMSRAVSAYLKHMQACAVKYTSTVAACLCLYRWGNSHHCFASKPHVPLGRLQLHPCGVGCI